MALDKALGLLNGLPTLKNWIRDKFVAKEAGKGLSTKDFTAEEKAKLGGIAAGAEVNTQADWNVTDTTSDAFLKNKPTSLPANGGNADTVGGKKVLKEVPADALFTDTVYAHPNTHPASMITGLPTTLPASGGNADTVGGHTVGVNVPANALFTDTTYADMKGASASVAGTRGLVPAPSIGTQLTGFLKADGTWQAPPDTTYSVVNSGQDGLMTKTDFVKLSAFQSAGNYALKTELAGVYKFKASIATESLLPASGNQPGDVYNIEAKSSYGAAGTNVAYKEDGTWDNLGGNFIVDYASAAEVLEVLNA